MKGAGGQLPTLKPGTRLYLFHGGDEAGAADLARRLVRGVAGAERIDLDGATLRREPGRLADEAASVSLFGDARVLFASPIGEESLDALTLLLAAPRADAPVVAHAPTVRSTAKIVKLAIEHPRALSIACYPPSAEQLDRLVATMLADAGLRAGAGAGVATRLAEAANGDRAVIAREIAKLALYLDAAPDRPRETTPGDLAAIGADLGESEQAEAIAALGLGQPGALGAALRRLDTAGASAIPWLRAIDRQLIGAADPARGPRFGDQAALAQAYARWTPAMLADALARLHAAQRAQLTPANAGAVTAEHAALALGRMVERRR